MSENRKPFPATLVALVITVVGLVITIAGFIYYYQSALAAIASAESATAAVYQQTVTLQTQLAAANAQISSIQNAVSSSYEALIKAMQTELAASKSQVSALQNDLAASKSQVASLQEESTSYKLQVASLQKDISSYKSQVSTLQSQLDAAGAADKLALQNQVKTLREQNAELNEIVKLNKVSVKTDFLAINQMSGLRFPAATFTADYAGYLVVAGQSTAAESYIVVENAFPDYPLNEYRYPFGTGARLVIPVLPGNVNVYFVNGNPGGAATGTISVRYYY